MLLTATFKMHGSLLTYKGPQATSIYQIIPKIFRGKKPSKGLMSSDRAGAIYKVVYYLKVWKIWTTRII